MLFSLTEKITEKETSFFLPFSADFRNVDKKPTKTTTPLLAGWLSNKDKLIYIPISQVYISSVRAATAPQTHHLLYGPTRRRLTDFSQITNLYRGWTP